MKRLRLQSRFVVLPFVAAIGVGCSANTKSARADDSGAQPIKAQPASPSGDVSGLVSSVQPAVVNITVEQLVKSRSPELDFGGESPFDFFFREFQRPGGRQGKIPTPAPREGKRIGAGSGFIIDAGGHVVTNAHVVDGADTVKVKLSDERELKAKVLGKDERLDVAVLAIEADSLGFPSRLCGKGSLGRPTIPSGSHGPSAPSPSA